MADPSEVIRTREVFTGNPNAAAALQHASEIERPFDSEIHSSKLALLLTGAVLAAEGAVERMMSETRDAANNALNGKNGIWPKYVDYEAQADTYSYEIPYADRPDELAPHTVEAPGTITFALEYLFYRAFGMREHASGFDPNVIQAAQQIMVKLPELDPRAQEVMWNEVLAGAAWGMVAGERDQLIVATLDNEHPELYNLAREIEQDFKHSGSVSGEYVGALLHHLGLGDHAEAIVTHVPGFLWKQIEHFPLAGEAIRKIVAIAGRLNNRHDEIGTYITRGVDNAIAGLAGLELTKLNVATIQTASHALDHMAAFSPSGEPLIPADIDREQLAQALLGLTVLENPGAVFGASSNAVQRQIGIELKLLALFDLNEEGDASLLKTALRLSKERMAAAASTAIDAATQQQP